jgi:hypothetical protein
MRHMKAAFAAIVLIVFFLCSAASAQGRQRWSEQKANAWYAQQPWLVGSNYVPKSAINQLEMWQKDTFDADEVDKEFGWAESLGMNTMRVFLHDLLWQQDAAGFRKRIDQFLTIASRHHIRPMYCAVRFGLGSVAASRPAASANPGNSQLRVGAESGGKGAGQSE